MINGWNQTKLRHSLSSPSSTPYQRNLFPLSFFLSYPFLTLIRHLIRKCTCYFFSVGSIVNQPFSCFPENEGKWKKINLTYTRKKDIKSHHFSCPIQLILSPLLFSLASLQHWTGKWESMVGSSLTTLSRFGFKVLFNYYFYFFFWKKGGLSRFFFLSHKFTWGNVYIYEGGGCCCIPGIGFCFLCVLCSFCWEEDVSVCFDGAIHSSCKPFLLFPLSYVFFFSFLGIFLVGWGA